MSWQSTVFQSSDFLIPKSVKEKLDACLSGCVERVAGLDWVDSTVLFHSSSLTSGCVFREPRQVDSTVAENYSMNHHVRGARRRRRFLCVRCVLRVTKAWDRWLRTIQILMGSGERLASCSGTGYDKTSIEEALLSILCSRDVGEKEGRGEREREGERERMREIGSRQGNHLGTF